MSEPRNDFTDGVAYESYMGRWSKMVGIQFLHWLGAPAQSKWLDVGCGNGAFTDEVIRQCSPSSVTGIDPSEGQIQYARQRHKADQADYHVGDAQNLPFGDRSFDVATMALVIAFVPNPSKGVAEMCRVTKPGGQVATYMWDLPKGMPRHPMAKILTEMGMSSLSLPSEEFSQMQSMRKLWVDAGLQKVESTEIRIPLSFVNFEEFKRWSSLPVGALSKSIMNLSAEAKEELYVRLKRTLPQTTDGRIAYECFANAVKGVCPA